MKVSTAVFFLGIQSVNILYCIKNPPLGPIAILKPPDIPKKFEEQPLPEFLHRQITEEDILDPFDLGEDLLPDEEENEAENGAEEEDLIPGDVPDAIGGKLAVVRPMSADSVCGAYLAADEVGGQFVFKPQEEEGISVTGQPLKAGVKFGESVAKEKAAYELDRRSGHFSGTLLGHPHAYLD
jgi:hypothetical protein